MLHNPTTTLCTLPTFTLNLVVHTSTFTLHTTTDGQTMPLVVGAQKVTSMLLATGDLLYDMQLTQVVVGGQKCDGAAPLFVQGVKVE